MDSLFGIPVDVLAVVLGALVAAATGTVAALAVRNRIFLRLGARNAARRPGRSALIVTGLMLATAIISASLVTGDTMSGSMRAGTLDALGATDELVSVRGAEVDPMLPVDTTERSSYFDEDQVGVVRDVLADSPLVDGVAPAVVESVAVQDLDTRQTEPRVVLFATDASHRDGFEQPSVDGETVVLTELGAGEVYLNEDAADELGASRGDGLVVYGRGGPVQLTVAGVTDFRGSGAAGPAALAPLALGQQIVGEPGRIRHVLVSNAGDEVGGATHTGEVTALLADTLDGLGLEAQPVKRDGLDAADEQGNAFLAMFGTFGSFSIAAGILLIFLIFVMLAAERRTEMGIARAVGTQRGHLVQSFLFEGSVYDLAAALVGAVLGLGIAFLMVEAVAAAFDSDELRIVHDVRPQSLFVAFGLGVILTLAVVTVSAWRVSRLDVVAAIRSLPSPIVRRSRRARGWRSLLVVALGALIAAGGASGGQATPFLLGVSVALIGVVGIARALGVPDRLAYTVGGLVLMAWWLLPMDIQRNLGGGLAYDFSVWIVSGLILVLGATWTVMWNADVLLSGIDRVVGRRVRSIAPVVRMAVAYPLRSRVRTSMTLAMFTLVVFTLVAGSTISGSFIAGYDDIDRYSGGFDLRATTNAVRPLDDVAGAAVDAGALDAADVEAVGRQSLVPVEMRQQGVGASYVDYPVRGVDDGFLATTTHELATVAEGYEDADAVWAALAARPGLAVADPLVAPRRDNFGFGPRPDLQLQGFVMEDDTFEPVTVEVRDPATGTRMALTVIGVLADSTPWDMVGMTTSQATLAPLGDRAQPTTHWLGLADGVDPEAAARAIEAGLLDAGVEAQSLQDSLDEAVAINWTFNRLIQGFMGLGLVVGVVALGVISARAVVERRQHIGVLRAIGFQPGMVRLAFLMEASFVALTAIFVGTVLGLALAYDVIGYLFTQEDIALAVPWVNLAVIFGTVYLAALASTLLPALRGARIYPAEALRYE